MAAGPGFHPGFVDADRVPSLLHGQHGQRHRGGGRRHGVARLDRHQPHPRQPERGPDRRGAHRRRAVGGLTSRILGVEGAAKAVRDVDRRGRRPLLHRVLHVPLERAREGEMDAARAAVGEVLLELDLGRWIDLAIDHRVDVATEDLTRDHPAASLRRRQSSRETGSEEEGSSTMPS